MSEEVKALIGGTEYTYIKEEGSVFIKSVACEDESLFLPSEIDGMPVVKICSRAFAESEKNGNVKMLDIPETVIRLEDFSLFGLRGLEKIRVRDTMQSWGAGNFAGHRNLRFLEMIRTGSGSVVPMEAFLSGLSEELYVDITEADGSHAKLLIPEYSEVSRESSNGQVIFQYSIQGAGYGYHQCLKHRELNYKNYDELWKDYMRRGFEEYSAVRLAWGRIAYPVQLSDIAKTRYMDFLKEHTAVLLGYIVENSPVTELSLYFDNFAADSMALSQAAEKARAMGSSDKLALILEMQHRCGFKGKEKSYDL